METVVLAYSGGLDTSIMIPWLKENYNVEVIALCIDLGQGKELTGLKEKALKSGAKAVIIDDLRESFVVDYWYPTLRSGALYESKYLLGTSIGRPLIAKRMVDVAHEYGATMVAHGATGKGNDQVRFELTFMALDPSLKIIAPWKDPKWTLTSREACVEYAHQHGIPIAQSSGRIYSEDANLLHISHEGGVLESLTEPVPDDVYSMSQVLADTPDTPDTVTLSFEAGIPVRVDGEAMAPVPMLEHLNALGAKHGIGQIDLVENRLVGMKSRGIYETPGGTIVFAAHTELEHLVLDRSLLHLKEKLALDYADLVYDGRWFSTTRTALDAFVTDTQKVVTGDITLSLFKGHVRPVKRVSPFSLYHESLSSFSDSELYNQADAVGFIKIYGLPAKINGMRDRGEL